MALHHNVFIHYLFKLFIYLNFSLYILMHLAQIHKNIDLYAVNYNN